MYFTLNYIAIQFFHCLNSFQITLFIISKLKLTICGTSFNNLSIQGSAFPKIKHISVQQKKG